MEPTLSTPSQDAGRKPLILPRSEHPISRSNLGDSALRVLYRLTAEGHRPRKGTLLVPRIGRLAFRPSGPYSVEMSRAEANALIGSWEWLERTGGNLTRAERLALLPSLVRTFGQLPVERLRLAMRKRARHSLSSEELWPIAPDSGLGRNAEEEARDLQSDSMLNHGYRTWVFGAALAKIDGASLDPELFHAGALLHDVGLEHISPGQCFTRRSGESVQAVAQRSGVDQERALEMMSGIGTHITPGLRYEQSPVGFYLQAGAMADLVGIRAWELPADLRGRAFQTYPSERIHEVLSRCWRTEAKSVPKGRANYVETLGAFSHVVNWLSSRG